MKSRINVSKIEFDKEGYIELVATIEALEEKEAELQGKIDSLERERQLFERALQESNIEIKTNVGFEYNTPYEIEVAIAQTGSVKPSVFVKLTNKKGY